MSSQIKGYFYDPVTKKYFKIDKEHAAAFRAASEAAAAPAETRSAYSKKRSQNTSFPKKRHQEHQQSQQQRQKRLFRPSYSVLRVLDNTVLAREYPRHKWDLLRDFPRRRKHLADIQMQSALPLLGSAFQHMTTTAFGAEMFVACAPKTGVCLDVWSIGPKNCCAPDNKCISTCYGVGEANKPSTFTSLEWVLWDRPCLAFSTLGTETTQGAVEVYEVNPANTQIRKVTDYKTTNNKASLWACEWARGSKRAALGYSSGKSVLVDFETLKSDIIFNDRKYLHKRCKTVPTSDVMSLAFDPESGDRGILLGRRNGSVHYVDTRESLQDYRPRANVCSGSVSCLKYRYSGRPSQFLASSTVGSLQLFDSRMWRAVSTIVEPLSTVLTPPKFAVSSDGEYVLWSIRNVKKVDPLSFTSYIQGNAQEESCSFCCWKVSDGSSVFAHEFKGSDLPAVSWTAVNGFPAALCTNSETRSVEWYGW